MVMAKGTKYSQQFKEDAVQVSIGASRDATSQDVLKISESVSRH